MLRLDQAKSGSLKRVEPGLAPSTVTETMLIVFVIINGDPLWQQRRWLRSWSDNGAFNCGGSSGHRQVAAIGVHVTASLMVGSFTRGRENLRIRVVYCSCVSDVRWRGQFKDSSKLASIGSWLQCDLSHSIFKFILLALSSNELPKSPRLSCVSRMIKIYEWSKLRMYNGGGKELK